MRSGTFPKFTSCHSTFKNPARKGERIVLLWSAKTRMNIALYLSQCPANSRKTFYIETFGCQMNAHDSEKVIGTLIMRATARSRRSKRPG